MSGKCYQQESSNQERENSTSDETTKYPPCIRAILIDSSSNMDEEIDDKIGSLYLIPCTGGSIGKSLKNLVSFPHNSGLDDFHASISYDPEKKSYLIQSLSSQNSIYLNDSKLEPNQNYEVKHLDKLSLGESNSVILSLHIHSGINTCIGCEPGEIMHKIKSEKEKTVIINDFAKNKEHLRRDTVKSIKKKYQK
jgi:hypothetical protein